MQKTKQKQTESKVSPINNEISLQLPDADEEKLINAGIDADQDAFEVSDVQLKNAWFDTVKVSQAYQAAGKHPPAHL